MDIAVNVQGRQHLVGMGTCTNIEEEAAADQRATDDLANGAVGPTTGPSPMACGTSPANISWGIISVISL
jgi:hypothetical protein